VLAPNGGAAHVGGEEFVLILPGHAAEQSRAVAARLAGATARYDWSTAGAGWRQPASFGLATHVGDAETLTVAFRAADRALYEAKRQGRDQVRELVTA